MSRWSGSRCGERAKLSDLSAQPPLRERPGYAVAVLLLVALVQSFDRNIAAVVAEPVRKEFGLSDAQLGLLGAAFTLVLALGSVPIGRLVDRHNRTRLLSAGVFVWSLLTVAGGFATSFFQLLVTRMGVGIGEATATPATMSILGNLYPPTKRGRAIAVVLTAIPVGVALSFGVGGLVARTVGWRAAFYLPAAPGLLCTVALLVMKEPVREAAAPRDGDLKGRSALGTILRIRTMWILTLANSLYLFMVSSMGTFILALLMRFHAVPLHKAGGLMMVMVGVAPVLGLLAGGAAADRLRKRRNDAAMLVAGVTCLLVVPFQWLALQQPAGRVAIFVPLMACSFLVMFPLLSLVQTAIQEVVAPPLRGTAIAVNVLVANVIGGFGPVVTGALSDRFARGAARAAAVSIAGEASLEPFRGEALRLALHLMPCIAALNGLMLLLALRRARADADALVR